jgi:AraC-like DNA-binding protein
MSLAANGLKKPATSTEAVAEAVGYQSVSAFRLAFAARMGMAPEDWRITASNWDWLETCECQIDLFEHYIEPIKSRSLHRRP